MEDTSPAAPDTEIPAGVQVVFRANFFRMVAGADVNEAVKRWGSEAFQAKWAREVAPVFPEEQTLMLEDFFSSAVVWVGGTVDSPTLFAFYNPWMDGLFLASFEPGGEQLALTDFAFVSGEGFRGDDLEDPSRSLSLYLLKEPLNVALARLYAGMDEVFRELYGPESGKDLIPAALQRQLGTPAEELALIQMRMTARMRMFAEYFARDNREWVGRMATLLNALKSDESAGLLGALSLQQDRGAVDNLFELSGEHRSGFGPNFFLRGEAGAVAALVNPYQPRWIVAVSFDNQNPAAAEARVEFMDLEISKTLLEQWEKGEQR